METVNNYFSIAQMAVDSSKKSTVEPVNKNAIDMGNDFRFFLHNYMDQLNADEQLVEQQNISFIMGESVEPHQIMIAAQKALLGVELTVQVRNKAVEAYQEIMRMQL